MEKTFRDNRGLITRAQAVRAGMRPEEVDALVRSGTWMGVRRAVYARRELIESLQTRSDRQRLRDDAACLVVTLPHVRSHDSAALVHGMPILLPREPMTHVTRPHITGSRNRSGVKHHLAPYRPDQVVDVGGVRVLDPARTAVDIAREHGEAHGVAAMDSARQRGVPLAELTAAAAPMASWPHILVVRRCLEQCDPGAESVGETLGRRLVESLGRGRPQTQFGLARDGRSAWVDMRLGRHLIEFDGKVKYMRPTVGGVATKSADEVVWEEKQRQDWLCGFKLGMSRLVWADVLGPGRHAAVARLEREIRDTDARFGTSIADLEPFILRRPRRVA